MRKRLRGIVSQSQRGSKYQFETPSQAITSVQKSLKRWIITAAHCCAKWARDNGTDTSYIIMADTVTAYFGEHSTYIPYENTGPTLKPERD